MFVIIEDNYRLYKYSLDNDIEYKSINIYQKNNQFFISLKNNFYFEDNSKIKKLAYSHYVVNIEGLYYQINVYVYKSIKGIENYALYENKNIKISNEDNADIRIFDPYIKDKYLIIEDNIIKSNFKIIVNNNQYNNQPLKQADIIEFLGFKIVYFDKFLYINHFLCKSRIKPYRVNEHIIKYKLINKNDNYYLAKEVKELEYEELKEYTQVRQNINNDLYKTLIPNLTMVLSISSLSFINFYNASIEGRDLLHKASYMIMPISMLITTFILPLLFYCIDSLKNKRLINKNVEDYLTYLDEYHDKASNEISKYLSDINSHYFNLVQANEKMFYAGVNTDDYLKISIGKTHIEKQFIYSMTNCERINKRLEEIKNSLSRIDDIPLFLDLKVFNNVTIITKSSLKKYYFYKFLLELSYKHHFHDINIGIYAKNLSIINEIYNLPHLFINGARMSFNSYNELQEINQKLLDKPLIIFMYDYCDFVFNNNQIIVLYFSDNRRNLYKDFKAIIEYNHNNGYLYNKSYKEFIYYQEDVNYSYYFNELGKYNSLIERQTEYSFNSIYHNFDIKKSYLSSNIGLKSIFAYHNNELISLDLHESKQGPHGLIGGSTGSGKSELIVSLLLSLCIRYSPEYLNIVLIDYKGGGIKESLSYNNKTIPHISACISNLENNTIERLIIALKHECIQRQTKFKNLSKDTSLSIMNIDDYNQYDNKRMTHLLIVVDEFAELKKQNPELIKELISLSRIGRSLGVHLILATQKPSGNIDDEIWSNSRFKLALKVFEQKDSIDILKIKDAAYIKDPGSFIMRIDESVSKGKAFYSKKDINSNDAYEISLLDNTLNSISEIKINNGRIKSEASYFCNKIMNICGELNILGNNLKFLPAESKMRKSFSSNNSFIFGEIDDYIDNKSGILEYSLNENILIYSERKDEINSILNTLNGFNRQSVVIGNKQYIGKYISDNLLFDNDVDIFYLFDKIEKNNLDLCLLIEDLNTFLTYNDEYLSRLYSLIKRSERQNFNIICFTNSSSISFKILNAFKNKVMIENSDQNNISSFFMMKSEYKGSCFYYDEKPISFIPIIIEDLLIEERIIERIINVIPENIEPEINNNMFFIGYDLNSREKVFVDNDILISSYSEELLDSYRRHYNDLEIKEYSHSIVRKDVDKVLWIGPGLYSQRLFTSRQRNDILRSQGILYMDGKERLIKVMNYV